MTIGMAGPTGKVGNKLPSGMRVGQIQEFTPQQMELFGTLFPHVNKESFLSKLAGGDEEMFRQAENPALRQFAGLQGGLASRFSGMGQGATRSSGFQNTMNQASSDFAQQLQANRLGLQRQALGDLMNMSNMLLNQRPYETFTYQKQPKQNALPGLIGGAIGGVGGFFAGGPMGALQGAQLGYGAGNALFGGGGGGGGGSPGNFGSLFNSQSPLGQFGQNFGQSMGNSNLMSQAASLMG